MTELAGAPAWQTFLEQSRDQLVEELQTPEPNPLASVGGRKQDQAGIAQLRAHGVQLADGLEAWHAICEAAATFKA